MLECSILLWLEKGGKKSERKMHIVVCSDKSALTKQTKSESKSLCFPQFWGEKKMDEWPDVWYTYGWKCDEYVKVADCYHTHTKNIFLRFIGRAISFCSDWIWYSPCSFRFLKGNSMAFFKWKKSFLVFTESDAPVDDFFNLESKLILLSLAYNKS